MFSIWNITLQKAAQGKDDVKVTHQSKGSILRSSILVGKVKEEMITRQRLRQKAANGSAFYMNNIHAS